MSPLLYIALGVFLGWATLASLIVGLAYWAMRKGVGI